MTDTSTPSVQEELDGRIQALPQELQDAIMFLTEGFDVPAVVPINESYTMPDEIGMGFIRYRKCYKLPLALQLNRKIRAKFAKKYYSSAVFKCTTAFWSDVCNGPTVLYPGTSHLFSWLCSLSEAYIAMIETIQLTRTKIADPVALSSAVILQAKNIRAMFMDKAGPLWSRTRLVFEATVRAHDVKERLEMYGEDGMLLSAD